MTWAERAASRTLSRAAQLNSSLVRDERQQIAPWGTGLTVAGFVAAVIGVAIVVLSLGLMRVHLLLAVGLNIVAVGGLAPTLWGWRRTPVLRWFVLGAGVGVAGAWLIVLAMSGSGGG
jgi:hypothetical protein